jgi:hypothetical protein
MSDVTNRLGLPIFISDYSWDGSSLEAQSLAATVTSGALLVSLTDSSIQVDPATKAQHGYDVMPFDVPTLITTLTVAKGQLYSIQAAATAGPVKVSVVNNTDTIAVRFFNSAFPNTDMAFPTGFVFSGTLSIYMTNLYEQAQTGYATIFYA